jgi:ADP-heptose:LPS heptosyltransferase
LIAIKDQQKQFSIAIFRALKLGDLLCTVPTLRAIRGAFPTANITLIGLPWAAEFVERYAQYLDQFIEFPGHPAFPERPAELTHLPDFLQQVQARRFDLAVQMHGSGEIANPLIALLGAKHTAGYYQPGQYRPDDSSFFPYPQHVPEIRRWLGLVESLGIPSKGEHLEFPLTESDRQEMQALASRQGLQPGPYVCIHPGASSPEKCWSPRYFAALADILAERGYQVVLTGSHREQALTKALQKAMQRPSIDLAGQTSLGALGALIAGARLLISNDTGVSHIAVALQTPSIVLFVHSEIERWAPLNRQLHRPVANAFDAGPQDVLPLLDDLLEKEGAYAL